MLHWWFGAHQHISSVPFMLKIMPAKSIHRFFCSSVSLTIIHRWEGQKPKNRNKRGRPGNEALHNIKHTRTHLDQISDGIWITKSTCVNRSVNLRDYANSGALATGQVLHCNWIPARSLDSFCGLCSGVGNSKFSQTILLLE